MPTPVSQKKHRATSSEPTPSRRATAMVATMGLSRSSSGSQRGNHGNVTLMTPVYQRFSPASGRRRSPLQPGMSLSMSSIFNTPSTAASRYSTGMAPHATPVDVGARSRAYFNPSIPVRNERF
ncbi:uncharacterized protein LOC144162701 isoform X2 [Haemaphysalis longicornis]